MTALSQAIMLQVKGGDKVMEPYRAKFDREVEVLRLAATGLTTVQIARRLVISPKTVDSHVQHIYAKIGCSTRGAAVLFALRHNLVG
jgi:DNA-binding CsgD family transcriptional regulator